LALCRTFHETVFFVFEFTRPTTAVSDVMYKLEVADGIVFVTLPIAPHRLEIIRMCQPDEVVISAVFWIEVVRGLADVLTSAGFDEPINSIVREFRRGVIYYTRRKSCQRCIRNAGNVARGIVGIFQVLHDCRFGEEL